MTLTHVNHIDCSHKDQLHMMNISIIFIAQASHTHTHARAHTERAENKSKLLSLQQ
jgi:hypothetical protein